MSYEQDKALIDVLKDEKASKDIKLYIIIGWLHEEKIGLHKAHELLYEHGIMSEPWTLVDFNLLQFMGLD